MSEIEKKLEISEEELKHAEENGKFLKKVFKGKVVKFMVVSLSQDENCKHLREQDEQWVEGVHYTIKGTTDEHPADAFARVLKKIKKEHVPEGKETDLSLRKNEYLYGTPE